MKKCLNILMAICLVLSIAIPSFAAGVIKKVKISANTKESPAAACARVCKDYGGTDSYVVDRNNQAGTVQVTCYCADFQRVERDRNRDSIYYEKYFEFNADLSGLKKGGSLGEGTLHNNY